MEQEKFWKLGDVYGISIDKINEVLESEIGLQKQVPPMYSAIKLNGKKLYEYARKGQEIDISSKARNIEIYDIKLLNYNEELLEITFLVHCSKGTYIRTLCEEIANRLGTIGYMKELERVTVGNFSIENSITLEQLEKMTKEEIYNKYLINIEEFFKDIPNIYLDEKRLQLLLNGVKLSEEQRGVKLSKKQEKMYKVYKEDNSFVGIANNKEGKIKREIILI